MSLELHDALNQLADRINQFKIRGIGVSGDIINGFEITRCPPHDHRPENDQDEGPEIDHPEILVTVEIGDPA